MCLRVRARSIIMEIDAATVASRVSMRGADGDGVPLTEQVRKAHLTSCAHGPSMDSQMYCIAALVLRGVMR